MEILMPYKGNLDKWIYNERKELKVTRAFSIESLNN